MKEGVFILSFIFAPIPAIAQQLPQDWFSVLTVYGPLALITAWLLLKAEKKFDKIADAMSTGHGQVIEEIRNLSHRIHGMSKAMLIDVISREDAGDAAKRKAQELLDKMNGNGAPHET